jgi:ParB family chromosome partitioning protein
MISKANMKQLDAIVEAHVTGGPAAAAKVAKASGIHASVASLGKEIGMTDAEANAAGALVVKAVTEPTESAQPAKGRASNPAGIVKRSNSYFADPRAIQRREGFNPRFDFGEIEELAKSIRSNGILNPLRVQRNGTGTFALVDGDRRLTAVELILKTQPDFFRESGVPVIIVDAAQDDITSLVQMFEANSGKTFLPMEEAIAYKRMRDAGMTLKKIGEHVGRKHVHIVATLALLEADEELQQAVKDGTIGATMGKRIAVAARGDKAKQKELVKAAKTAGKSSKGKKAVKAAIETQRRSKAKKEGRKLKVRALDDAQLGSLGERLAALLVVQMNDVGLEPEADMAAWLAKADQDQRVAFTYGALQALKVAAGMPESEVGL